MKKTPLKSKSKLKTKKGLAKSGSLKAGKKVLEWQEIREQLKKEFAEKNITSCELKFEGCTGNWALGFCHSKKRRFIEGNEIYEVILACSSCHLIVEYSKDMTKIVREVIAKRGK